jgi:hypothetical protein
MKHKKKIIAKNKKVVSQFFPVTGIFKTRLNRRPRAVSFAWERRRILQRALTQLENGTVRSPSEDMPQAVNISP